MMGFKLPSQHHSWPPPSSQAITPQFPDRPEFHLCPRLAAWMWARDFAFLEPPFPQTYPYECERFSSAWGGEVSMAAVFTPFPVSSTSASLPPDDSVLLALDCSSCPPRGPPEVDISPAGPWCPTRWAEGTDSMQKTGASASWRH